MESYLCNLQHSWMSMEGQAESYNDLWWDSHKVEMIRRFLDRNPAIGKHFDKKILTVDIDEIELPLDDNLNENEGKASGKGIFSGMQELHRKSLSQVWIYSISGVNFESKYL
jgi:hypothetical protein